MQPIVIHVLTPPCMTVNLPHKAARCAHASGNKSSRSREGQCNSRSRRLGRVCATRLDAGRRSLAQGTVPIGTARIVARLFLARHFFNGSTRSVGDTSTQPLNDNILYFVATVFFFFLGGGIFNSFFPLQDPPHLCFKSQQINNNGCFQ